MNPISNEQARHFKRNTLRVRVMAAVMSGAVSLGVMACVVGGMAEQSGGQSLGEFVASRGAQQAVMHVAAVAAPAAAF